MRHKEHTISKLEGQISKLKTLQRFIETRSISAEESIQLIDKIVKDLNLVIERLGLEPNE